MRASGPASRRWLASASARIVGVGVCAIVCACGPRSATPALELKVATWNLRWFPSGQPERQPVAVEGEILVAAAREVRRVEPHIFCAQEVRDREAAEALARQIGLRGLTVAACSDFVLPDGTPGPQQVAILTTLPILEAGVERWHTSGSIDPPRGFAFARLESPAGPVVVFSVHLKSNFVPEGEDPEVQNDLNRRRRESAAEQLRIAADRLAARPGQATARIVVAGDLNTSLDSPRWKGERTLRCFLDAGYTSCFAGLPSRRTHTLPATELYPAVTFDYIFHRGFAAQRGTQVAAKRWVSDHCMVSVRLVP